MKTRRNISRETGTTLIITLVTAGILAAVLGTYLRMTSQENLKVKRSVGWNAALPMAEAGIEEACSQINANMSGYWNDGWTFNTTNFTYNKTRFLGDSYYSVGINGWPGGLAFIKSTGYGAWTGSNYISRTVEVTARTPTPFYPNGLIANNIGFQGNFYADSFNSTNGAYSKLLATDHALIASPPGSSGYTINGTANIYGYVACAVGAVIVCGGSAVVGDFSYNTKGVIQPGHVTNTYAQVYPPVTTPFGPTTPGVKIATSGTNAGTFYNYVLNGGYYYAPDLAASGGKMYVSGTTMLLTTGAVNLASITFAVNPTNPPQLNLVFGGSSLDNFIPSLINGSAPQFWVFALPTCTSMKMTSGGDYVGVIYGPTVDLSAQGGSITGAILANSFNCQGNFSFHYDDATSGAVAKKFQIISWNEQ
jgi:hypothetical protein